MRPGLVVLAIAFGASQTGVAIAYDLATGMIDRFRALQTAAPPFWPDAPPRTRSRNLFVLTLMSLLP